MNKQTQSVAIEVQDFLYAEELQKPFSVEQAFCAVPALYAYFSERFQALKNYEPSEWERGASREKLSREITELCCCFRRMRIEDLQILWYLHNGRFASTSFVCKSLQRAYDAECSAKSLLGFRMTNPLTACVRHAEE